jgi:hypothetical protein
MTYSRLVRIILTPFWNTPTVTLLCSPDWYPVNIIRRGFIGVLAYVPNFGLFASQSMQNFIGLRPASANPNEAEGRIFKKWTHEGPNFPKMSMILLFFSLKQGWPTQIGLWAATWKFCLKYWLFGPQYTEKLKKYTQNYEKLLILNSKLGRRNLFLGHMRPVGRRLATPALKGRFLEKVEGPQKRASRAACGPRAAGWPTLP